MYSIVSMLITLSEYYSDISRKQEELFISSYKIKMKSYKIKPSFVSPEGPKVRTNKTGINSFLKIFSSLFKFYNAVSQLVIFLKSLKNIQKTFLFNNFPNE